MRRCEENMKEELKWFASFPEELKKFRGKHVAIIKDKIVASGDDAIEVLQKAKKQHPNKRLVLAFVPREETFIWDDFQTSCRVPVLGYIDSRANVGFRN